MENTETNNQNYTELLQNVRKAHRLIYSYQDCLKSIAKFIGKELKFNGEMIGYKPFCDRLHNKNSCDNYRTFELPQRTPFQIEGRWAWDFIDSYEIEYAFEAIEGENVKDKYYLSIFQVTDNGYFLKKKIGKSETERCKVKNFEKVEDSQSYLIVVLYNEAAAKNAAKGIYNSITPLYTSNYDRKFKPKKDEVPNETPIRTYYTQRFKIEDFTSRKATIDKIDEFKKNLKDNLPQDVVEDLVKLRILNNDQDVLNTDN